MERTVRCPTDENAKNRLQISIAMQRSSRRMEEHMITSGIASKPVDKSLTARLVRKAFDIERKFALRHTRNNTKLLASIMRNAITP